MAVVLEPPLVGSSRVGALDDALDRMLDRAQAIAVQPTDLVRVDAGVRRGRGPGRRRAQSRYQRHDHEEYGQHKLPLGSSRHSHTRRVMQNSL